jgi:hypothetical protein
MPMMRVVSLFGILAVVGCTGARREAAPSALFDTAAPVGFPASVRHVSADRRGMTSRSADILKGLQASSTGTLNILALSGGGAGGAFGAGALVGLSRRGERPQFQIVTGVSTGALIAPFAFLGSAWDAQLTEAYLGGRSVHLLQSRRIGILFHPGLYRSAPLVELVDHYVTDDLIQAVAREAASGRLLLVATTDLDKEETVIWNMGAIATQGGQAARKLFRDVLVASASIPGLFAPVIIRVEDAGVAYDEMHADGGATVPFFVAPEAAFVTQLDSSRLAGANIYVLVNGQLGGAPRTTRFASVPILSRSFSAALKHMSRTGLELTAGFALRYSMVFRFTEIPVDYPDSSSFDFRESHMRALFNYGAECAQEGRLWTTVDQAIARGERAIANQIAKRRPAQPQRIPPCPLDDPA